ncbi:MAG: phosphate ABC transporter substrate-binding protein [Lachnospirales bacterium]
MKSIVVKILILITLSIFATSCRNDSAKIEEPKVSASTGDTTISIVGSTTIQPMAQALADGYMANNTDVIIEVQGAGSSVGIQSAIHGTADIGTTSRKLREDEVLEFEELKEYTVAHDAIAVIVNPANPINNFSLETTRKIFTGEISNWSELGWEDADIVVTMREEASGTRDTFENKVGIVEPSSLALVNNSNGAVKAAVATQAHGISYISLGTVDKTVKTVSIGGVLPTLETTKRGTYKISRDLTFITEGEVSEEVGNYIDFTLSSTGQEIVKKHYLPIS